MTPIYFIGHMGKPLANAKNNIITPTGYVYQRTNMKLNYIGHDKCFMAFTKLPISLLFWVRIGLPYLSQRKIRL